MIRKKISIIHPFFTQYGGAEKVVLDLAKHVAKKYGSCHIYTSVINKSFKNITNNIPGVEFIVARKKVFGKSLFGYKFNPFLLLDMIKLSKKIEKSDYTICTNWPSNIASYLSRKFFGNSNSKSIYLCFEPDHGLHHKKMKTSHYISTNPIKVAAYSLILFPFRLLDEFIVKREKRILTLSANIKTKVKKVFGSTTYNKTKSSLHDYVNVESVKVNKKKNDTITILSICRLEKSKNLDIIIKAFKKLQPENKKTRLLIGGTGPEEKYLKKIANNVKQISFLGFVKENDLPKIYNKSDIFVFAGEDEPSGPLTMLEAMSYENAVIAPNEGGPVEIIKNQRDGLIFKPRSIDDLYNKMKFLLKNKVSRKRLGAEGRRKVMKLFSAKSFFAKFDSVINKI